MVLSAFKAGFIHDLRLLCSFNTLCQCTRKSFASMASDRTADIPGDLPLKCVYFTIRELTAVIALKVSVVSHAYYCHSVHVLMS